MGPVTAGAARAARVVGIDALRLFAALAVFVCHIQGYWGPVQQLPAKLPELMQLLAHGVDLFVVLSGFALTYPVALGQPILVGNFLKRRAWRLLPPYYVALVVAAAFAMGPLANWVVARPASFSDLFWHLSLLQTFNPDTLGTINGSLWSVALEAQLYLVFPLALFAIRRRRAMSLLVGAAIMSMGADLLQASQLTGSFGDAFADHHGIVSRYVQFAAGMACAVLVRRGTAPGARSLSIVALGSAVVAAAAQTVRITFASNVLWAIPSAAIVLLVANHVGPTLARTPAERMGKASYSFYLVHQPVLLVVAHLVLSQWQLGAWAALGIALTVALALTSGIAAALYFLVERPSHRFGRRHYRITASQPSVAEVASQPV